MPESVPKKGSSNTPASGASNVQKGPTKDQGGCMSSLADLCRKCKKSPCGCGTAGSSSSSAGQGEEYIRNI